MSMGKKVKSDSKIFTVHEGVTYLFSAANAKKMFDAHPEDVVSRANEPWTALNQ